jgi:integrase
MDSDLSDTSTLRQFFDGYYRPVCLADAEPMTLVEYQTTLGYWERFAGTEQFPGGPPLARITALTLADFRDRLKKLKGRRPATTVSPHTVRKHMRQIQAVLDRSGPSARGKLRDAAGLIPHPPWVRPPEAYDREPRSVPLAVIDRIYESCSVAYLPEGEIGDVCYGSDRQRQFFSLQILPVQWWRALVVVLYYTGIRIGSLLGLQDEDVTWAGGLMRLRGEITKTGKAQEFHLRGEWGACVLRHLLKVRTGAGQLFPWVQLHHPRTLWTHWRRIQYEAGIKEADQFGFHRLRKTNATQLYKQDPAAAQEGMAHSDRETTERFYVDPAELDDPRELMPKPKSFFPPEAS